MLRGVRRVERLVWNLTPPILRPGARSLRRALARIAPRLREWEYVPEGWAHARTNPRIRGWNVAVVAEAYERRLPVFREAVKKSGPLAIPTSPAAVDAMPSVGYQNVILAYAYALALASRNSDSLSILDWGGGVGFFYLLSRALLPPQVEIDYHCKEVALVCAHGREALPEVHFHEDESCLARRYDLVVASGSLQFSEQWSELLERLAGATARYLYVTRLAIVFTSRSFVVLQRPYAYGFETEYLSWVLNHDEFIDAAGRSGMKLVREFLQRDKPVVHAGPEPDETRAFLFQPTAAA